MDWERPSLAPAAPPAPLPSSSSWALVALAILGDTESTSEPPKIPSASGKPTGNPWKGLSMEELPWICRAWC